MWVATVLHQPVVPVPPISTSHLNPRLFHKPKTFCFGFRFAPLKLKVSATKKQLQIDEPDSEDLPTQEKSNDQSIDLGWVPAFPHVSIASMSNFLFGYHIGVMNGPIISIARELGFEGDPILEGLVVSIFIAGAFVGSISCGSLVDKLGCRRTFQIDTIPLIVGAIVRWRTMFYIASIPGFLLALGMQFSVESPRWLCRVGNINDAESIIRNLWGESEVEKAIEEFQSVIKNDGNDVNSRWLELLDEPHSRVAFVGGALFALQQFAGINGVLYFSSLTFQDVGIASGALASLFVGLTNFAASHYCQLVDVSRCTLCILLYRDARKEKASYWKLPGNDEDFSHNLSILGTLMYIFTFAIGAGPVTGLIIPELSSNRTRGKIMGFSFSVHWVCNFLVGLFFLDLVEIFGVAPVYAGFGSVSLLSAIFALYFIVETKGRSLEEIEMSMNSNFPAKSRRNTQQHSIVRTR